MSHNSHKRIRTKRFGGSTKGFTKLKVLAVLVALAMGVSVPLINADRGGQPSRAATIATTSAPVSPTAVQRYYSKETPYRAPTTSVKVPPKGYSMFFIENIGRHGSRSATTTSTEKRVLKVWDAASRKNSLTPLGTTLARDLARFQTVEKRVGYGDLSTRGKAEWHQIGMRTANNYSAFFASLQRLKYPVKSTTTTIYRTKQSMSAFESGLTRNYTKLALVKPTADSKLINFDSVMSKQGAKDLAAIKRRPDVVAAATRILKLVYTASYVKTLSSPVDKALDIYSLYCTAAGMSDDTPITFARYVTTDNAAVMAYVKDAATFYRYGPGLKGENSTYKGAKTLRDSFVRALDARINGSKSATVFRIAHGETTVPFAALLQLPGSEKQATKNVPYTYANNPWRGEKAGGLAGNIEWVAYRNSKKQVVVTMRYNEVPVRFRSTCKSTVKNGFFYSPAELKRCLPSN